MTKEMTLMYIIRDGRILLMKGKKGMNAGKFNGPGGKLEKGEVPMEAAIRETIEEIGVVPLDPEYMGINDFFDGKEHLKVHVFLATEFYGEPRETEEGAPQWFPVDGMPLKNMWPDDEFWMPLMLQKKKFH